MASGNLALLTRSIVLGGTVAANRLVTAAGAYVAAGAAALGATRLGGDQYDLVPVDVLGTTLVEASGTVTAGGPVMCSGDGKVVDLAGASKATVGIALEAGSNGSFVEILLTPGGNVSAA